MRYKKVKLKNLIKVEFYFEQRGGVELDLPMSNRTAGWNVTKYK